MRPLDAFLLGMAAMLVLLAVAHEVGRAQKQAILIAAAAKLDASTKADPPPILCVKVPPLTKEGWNPA